MQLYFVLQSVFPCLTSQTGVDYYHSSGKTGLWPVEGAIDETQELATECV